MRSLLLPLLLCGALSAADPVVQSICVYTADGRTHAIAVSQDRVYEVSFDSQNHAEERLLARIPGASQVATYRDPSDARQHVLVASGGGDLVDLSESKGQLEEADLGNIGRCGDMAAFFSPEDHAAHVWVLDPGGAVQDVWIREGAEVGRETLSGYKNPLRIAAVHAPDFQAPALYIAQQDGEVHETFWFGDRSRTDASVERILDIADIAGTYSLSDQRRVLFAVTGDGDLYEVQLSPFHGNTTTRMAAVPGAYRLAAWIDPSDGSRHVLSASIEGELRDLCRGADGKVHQRVVASIQPPSPTLEDIGPDTPQGVVHHGASSAGLVYSLAGGGAILYAVSLNAGVWKCVGEGRWQQLAASPPLATSIAADPRDPAHLVVGERDGEAKDVRLNRSGAWESTDAGEGWRRIFDPLSIQGCASQAIPAVLITPKGTVLLGTAAGIARRRAGAKDFETSASPKGCGLVSAIARSAGKDGETLLWARAGIRFLLSRDEGDTWKCIDIPATVDGYGTTGLSRGDVFSLAAIGETAVTLFISDAKTEKQKLAAVGNRNTILYYDAAKDRWRAQVTDSGNGTGLGGRRSLRAFLLDRTDIADGLGKRSRLLFLGGQDVLSAKGWREDGTADWERIALTECGEPGADPIHSDIWDAALSPDGDTVYIACDGGVFRRRAGAWVSWVEGLHTQHVHTVEVLPTGHLGGSRLAFATSDNSEWMRDARAHRADTPPWRTWNMTGDANWTASDEANPALALIVRHSECALLTDFETAPPEEAQRTRTTCSTLSCDQGHFGLRTFCFIQTLRGELPPPLLDAVMLAWPPILVHKEAALVAVSQGNLAGAKNATGGPILIRNRRFAANPDVNLSQYAKDWTVESSDLPATARAIWVSGGHGSPVYYTMATDEGGAYLYRRDLINGGWRRLVAAGRLVEGGTFGPVYVNPYDSRIVYVLNEHGVRESYDQGETFQEDPVLTALITASGTCPLTPSAGGNGTNVVLPSRANWMGSLARMVFSREDTRSVAVASPYTGVFFRNGAAPEWRSLAPYLPRPCAPVADVGMDAEAIYVATEGRGLFRVRDFRAAPLATFFEGTQLLDGAARPIAGAPVTVCIGDAESRMTTGSDGCVSLPPHEGRVVRLRYEGGAGYAPCEAAFRE